MRSTPAALLLAGRLVRRSQSFLSENVLRAPSSGHVGSIRRRRAPAVPVRRSHGRQHSRSLRPAEPGPRDGLQPLDHGTGGLNSHAQVCLDIYVHLSSIKQTV